MKKNYYMVAILAVILVIAACQKEDDISPHNIKNEPLADNAIKLGKKLENPYTVENMQKAYDNLKKDNKLKSSFQIQTTDLYVRFLPKDSTELNTLEADSLFLFDYPLDYEIEQVEYLGEELELKPKEENWYYTSVPVNYEFPDIQYEILANLFLPPEDDQESETKAISLWHDLEDEALKITGNYEVPEPDEISDSHVKRSHKHRPQGYVRVMDTYKDKYVGVEKVRVRTRRWFKYGRDYTDSNGYYSVNRRYRRSVHYCVFFKNQIGFKIRARAMSIWKAKHHVGKHNRRGYDINIGTGSRAWRFATLNNAVAKYWSLCDRFGIQKPHSNLRLVAKNASKGNSATPMLKHVWGAYGFRPKSGIASLFYKFGFIGVSYLANTFFRLCLPDIVVTSHSDKGTDKVYLTAFHELAHASHFKKVGSRYWIKYINYIITYGKKSNPYGSGTGKNAGYCGVGEMWANFCSEYFYRYNYKKSKSPEWKPDKDFYDPGFLMDAVNEIPDLSIQEVSYCLTGSVTSIPKLRDRLKIYTSDDAKIDKLYNK
ncbi:hypothetical protein, partial [Marinifilum sp. D737]|uniref:hypothetical protein n=1 Tax=Marinifilum sp. D737 TaxID=2969628 RepID=UPI002272C109